MRLTDSLYAGCIPILVADGLDYPLVWRFDRNGHVRIESFESHESTTLVPLPFDWIVDYASFAIRVTEEDFVQKIDNIIAGLRLIASDKYLLNCMRHRLLLAAHHFDYVGVFDDFGVDNALRAVHALSLLQNDSSAQLPSGRSRRVHVLPSRCDFGILQRQQ